ncbi:GPW/gp25 family protein [Microlunatus speluncae]|uniref:GPW/gp25 family protein n=1 Tax=Microlunatus speluncae TaxID=2594267 RepID=UPI00126634EF|nr:GPW/gp25 family protein [Microlunatus speluncae]
MTSRNRAFRFVGVGWDSDATGLTLTATGGVSMIDGDESIRQAILLLLCTTPGERLMRPQYGSHLHRLMFAPNDRTNAGLAMHYVQQAIERWEPRVEIVELDAEANPELASRLDIRLIYRVRASLATAEINFPLDLDERLDRTAPDAAGVIG